MPIHKSRRYFQNQLANTADADEGAALVGNAVQIVNTLAALKALAGTASRDVYVRGRAADGDGYEGQFRWDGSNLSAEVTADTQNAIYVPPNSDTTGASGAWVRRYAGRVHLEWFGVVFDDATDNYNSLSAALNSAPNLGGWVAAGKARFGTGLLWNKENIGLYGVSPPTFSVSAISGPALKYTGAGTGLTIGKDPDVNDNFLNGSIIDGLLLGMASNTAIGLRLWHLSSGRFRDLTIDGSDGATTSVGVSAEGCINTVLDSFNVTGVNQSGNPATYLGKGVHVQNGFGGSVTTTFRIINSYLHYCLTGLYMDVDSNVAAVDCVFESCTTRGVYSRGRNRLTRCWFEANIGDDIYFEAGSTTILEDCHIDAYARQDFFNGNEPYLVVLRNCHLGSTDASPRMFNPAAGPFSTTRFVLDNNRLPANFKISALSSTWRNVQVVGMRLETYRFRLTGVTANTGFAMPQDNGSTEKYVMPEKGHVLGSYCTYLGATITAGAFDTDVNLNGVGGVLTGAASATSPLEVNSQYYEKKFTKGSTLGAYVHTDAAFAATGGEFVMDVIVAFGEDGTP